MKKLFSLKLLPLYLLLVALVISTRNVISVLLGFFLAVLIFFVLQRLATTSTSTFKSAFSAIVFPSLAVLSLIVFISICLDQHALGQGAIHFLSNDYAALLAPISAYTSTVAVIFYVKFLKKSHEPNGSSRKSKPIDTINACDSEGSGASNPASANQEYADSNLALTIAEGELPLLEQKGLQKYLMQDYTAPHLSYNALRDINHAQASMIPIFADIMKYLNLPPFIKFHIELEREQSPLSKSQAGVYKSSLNDKEICLTLSKSSTPDTLLAALCHECTHYFMTHHDLNWQDETLNEVRTDVTANLIGFSNLLQHGYKKTASVEHEAEHQITYTHKIGYISADDCQKIREFLLQYRRKIDIASKFQHELDDEKKQLVTAIQGIAELSSQLKYLNMKEIPIQTSNQLSAVQQALMDYESIDFERELQKYKTAFESCQNLQQLKKYNENAHNLCSQMLKWCSILQA